MLVCRVPSELMLTFPQPGTSLTRGKQYNITWNGVLVPSVSILLLNLTDGTTTHLGTEANTGFYTWSLEARATLKGQYKLYLSALDGMILTEPVLFEIEDPIVPRPRVNVEEPSAIGTTLHSGDWLTVKYTSEVRIATSCHQAQSVMVYLRHPQ